MGGSVLEICGEVSNPSQYVEVSMQRKAGHAESNKSGTATGKNSRIHGRGTSRDEGARPRAEAESARKQGQGGRRKRLLAKIAEMPEPDRTMAERLHAIIKAARRPFAENR